MSFFSFSYILCVHLYLFFICLIWVIFLKRIRLFAQPKLLHREPVSVLNKLLESKDARKKTGNNSGVFFNMVLTRYFDISNNLNAISLLTDVMEELGLGDVDDLEGNFGPGWILHDSLNVFVFFVFYFILFETITKFQHVRSARGFVELGFFKFIFALNTLFLTLNTTLILSCIVLDLRSYSHHRCFRLGLGEHHQ